MITDTPAAASKTTEAFSLDLGTRWQALRAAKPELRIRDAAAALGTTELELLATTVGTTARWLDHDGAALVHGLVDVGRCMALTRNDSAVSEVRGRYGGVELGPHAGQVVGDGIDLRVFMSHWRYALAVTEPDPRGGLSLRRSIHVFDGAGVAVHKVYLEAEGGDPAAWDALVAARAAATAPTLELTPAVAPPTVPDDAVDVAALRADWDAMTDTHEFFLLLRKHRVTRPQALRLAGPERARQVHGSSLGQVLAEASETALRLMLFIGNRGCLQVFSGTVARIKRMGPWLNVLDPDFNLHLREDHLASSWWVDKPTAFGTVRSLELFDATGNTIAMVFAKRDDRRQVEDSAWAALLGRLPALPALLALPALPEAADGAR